jgi:hypothetical protein
MVDPLVETRVSFGLPEGSRVGELRTKEQTQHVHIAVETLPVAGAAV